jgi:hypothetical protein
VFKRRYPDSRLDNNKWPGQKGNSPILFLFGHIFVRGVVDLALATVPDYYDVIPAKAGIQSLLNASRQEMYTTPFTIALP